VRVAACMCGEAYPKVCWRSHLPESWHLEPPHTCAAPPTHPPTHPPTNSQCLLVVTKPASTTSGAPGGASLSGGGGSWPAAATATLRPGSIRAQQELSIEVPEIGARLDSRQFEILVDVVQNTFMAPLPQVGPGAAIFVFLGGGGRVNQSVCRIVCPSGAKE
jgi:hypothetical protein